MDESDLNIAFIDLETTGSDETEDYVLELGVIVTDPDLVVLEEHDWVIRPTEDSSWITLIERNGVVLKMHTDNGLIDDVITEGVETERADTEAAAMLANHVVRGRCALGGSGVGHFDSRFIRRYLPKTAKRLTYWPYDTGPIRRMIRLAGRQDLLLAYDESEKVHRAIPDARDSLTEARHYVELIRTIERS